MMLAEVEKTNSFLLSKESLPFVDGMSVKKLPFSHYM